MMPLAFINHGGGGVSLQRGPGHKEAVHGAPISAVVVFSAHHESRSADAIEVSPPPELINFLEEAPGSAGVAVRVKELLESESEDAASRPFQVCFREMSRYLDHDVLVPLQVFGLRDVPVVQVSLSRSSGKLAQMGATAARNFELGERLRPLRQEGVLLVGSGMAFHNLPAFFGFPRTSPSGVPWPKVSTDFDVALRGQLCGEVAGGRAFASDWTQKLPRPEECHPREEHILPLFVVYGAVGKDERADAFSGKMMNISFSDFIWKGDSLKGTVVD